MASYFDEISKAKKVDFVKGQDFAKLPKKIVLPITGNTSSQMAVGMAEVRASRNGRVQVTLDKKGIQAATDGVRNNNIRGEYVAEEDLVPELDETDFGGASDLGGITFYEQQEYEGSSDVDINQDLDISGGGSFDLTSETNAGADQILAQDISGQYREKMNILATQEKESSIMAGNIQQTSWDNQLNIFGKQSQSTLVALQEIVQDNSPNFLPENIQDTIAAFEASIQGNATDFVDALNVIPIADVTLYTSGDFPVQRTSSIDGSSTFALDDEDQALGKDGKRSARVDTYGYMSTSHSTNKALRLLESISAGENAGPGKTLPLNVGDSQTHKFYTENFIGPAPRSGTNIEAKEQFSGASFIGPTLPIDGDIEATRRLSPRERADEEYATAMSNITLLAKSYIHPESVGGHLEESQTKQLEKVILHRFMTSPANIEAKSLMPLPNETGVLGLKRTSGSYNETVGGQGTPYTRLEFGYEASKQGWTPEKNKDEWFGYQGTIRKSLFKPSFVKGDISGNERKRRESYQQEDQFFELAKESSRILRRHFPSNRNESAGESLSPGFDHPYADQMNLYHNLDQVFGEGGDYGDFAAPLIKASTGGEREYAKDQEGIVQYKDKLAFNMLDAIDKAGEAVQIDYIKEYDSFGEDGEVIGTTRDNIVIFGGDEIKSALYTKPTGEFIGGKAYGDTPTSALSSAMEVKEEEEKFRIKLENVPKDDGDPDFMGPTMFEGIKQHTSQWYKARQGLITASGLTNQNGTLLDAEGLAAELALQEFAKTDPDLAKELAFKGNADTVEGTAGEKEALKEFLKMKKTEGDPLIHTDVGLLQNKNLPGFGASPDGRLKDLKGNNRGLLELKWLTKGSAKTAQKKYMAQMQMQMAVTGEKTTDFFVYEKHTGISHHEVVEADPKMQAELIRTGQEAIAMLPTLTQKEAEELKSHTPAQRSRATSTLEENNLGNPEAEATTYVKQVDTIDVATTFTTAEINTINKQTNRLDRKKAISGGYESVAAMKEFNDQMELGTAQAREVTANNQEALKATMERTKADKEAAAASRKLRDSAMGAAKNLLAMGLDSNDSAMDTINLANRAGMEESQARAFEFALTSEGGLKLGDAKSVIESSGKQTALLTQGTTAGAELLRMQEVYASTPALYKKFGALAGREELLEMGSAGRIKHVQGMMNQLEEGSILRPLLAKTFFNDDRMSMSVATPETMDKQRVIDTPGNRAFYKGRQDVTFFKQQLAETAVGATGEIGGEVTQLTQIGIDNSKFIAWAADNKIAAGSAAALTGTALLAWNAYNNRDIPNLQLDAVKTTRDKMRLGTIPLVEGGPKLVVGEVEGEVIPQHVSDSIEGEVIPQLVPGNVGGEYYITNSGKLTDAARETIANSKNIFEQATSGNKVPKTPKQILEERSRKLSDNDFLMGITPIPDTTVKADIPIINVQPPKVNNVITVSNVWDSESNETKVDVGEDQYVEQEWNANGR